MNRLAFATVISALTLTSHAFAEERVEVDAFARLDYDSKKANPSGVSFKIPEKTAITFVGDTLYSEAFNFSNKSCGSSISCVAVRKADSKLTDLETINDSGRSVARYTLTVPTDDGKNPRLTVSRAAPTTLTESEMKIFDELAQYGVTRIQVTGSKFIRELLCQKEYSGDDNRTLRVGDLTCNFKMTDDKGLPHRRAGSKNLEFSPTNYEKFVPDSVKHGV